MKIRKKNLKESENPLNKNEIKFEVPSKTLLKKYKVVLYILWYIVRRYKSNISYPQAFTDTHTHTQTDIL